jgi:flagellar hook-length control protein FliK
MPLELSEAMFAKSTAYQEKRGAASFHAPSEDAGRRFQNAMEASSSMQMPADQMPVQNLGLGVAQEAPMGDVTARTAEIAETVSRIIEAVSAQIEVNPAMARGEEEVVIHLKPTVLDGSEIKLSTKDGILSLEITPATSAAEQLIARNIPQLERALAEHVPSFRGFTVAVRRGRDHESE